MSEDKQKKSFANCSCPLTCLKFWSILFPINQEKNPRFRESGDQEKNPRFRESGDSDEDEDDRKRRP